MRQLSLQLPVSLSISEITHYLREVLESDPILQDVWVQGEISNLSRPSSGHIYFTLKDAAAALRCVIWKSTAMRVRIPLQNGQMIEAHGYVSLYERDGAYQLYVDSIKAGGEGELFQAFMRLKASLEEEGLFDQGRKRPIPLFPNVIGIVTSRTGAALQDMLNTLSQRYRLAQVIVAPTAVQGQEAPKEIVAALQKLNKKIKPDVIILARGGGSLEDLWAFNDENVVRAVVASAAPVITGVGHETDFTLADFAADLRAPTPTGAAVAATPDQADLKAGLEGLSASLQSSMLDKLLAKRQVLNQVQNDLKRESPVYQVQNDRQRLDEITLRLERTGRQSVFLEQTRLEGALKRLNALNPTSILQRGYAIVSQLDGKVVRQVGQVTTGETLVVQVSDGRFNVDVN
jgi:exodeoxyribonuclease VII large subunit